MLWLIDQKNVQASIFNYPMLFGTLTKDFLKENKITPIKNVYCYDYNPKYHIFYINYQNKPYNKKKQVKLVRHFCDKMQTRLYAWKQDNYKSYYTFYDNIDFYSLPYRGTLKNEVEVKPQVKKKQKTKQVSHSTRNYLRKRKCPDLKYYSNYNNISRKSNAKLRHQNRKFDFKDRDDFEHFRARRSTGWKQNKKLKHQWQKNIKNSNQGDCGNLYSIYTPELRTEALYFDKKFLAKNINRFIDPVTTADLQLSHRQADTYNCKNNPLISMYIFEKRQKRWNKKN